MGSRIKDKLTADEYRLYLILRRKNGLSVLRAYYAVLKGRTKEESNV